MIVIKVGRLPFGYIGFSFFFFIFIDRNLNEHAFERTLLEEKLHFWQQVELLFVGMWFLYLLNYAVNWLIYLNHDQAYENILWEVEAKVMDGNKKYLKRRRAWQVFNYL